MFVKRIGQHDLELPSRGTEHSAGYDLRAMGCHVLQPGEQKLIGTGFAWEIPLHHVGLIRDRSGHAFKKRLTTRAGVIDCDYRGEVKVLVVNESDTEQEIEHGERIAQMIIIPYYFSEITEVTDFISNTERSDRGFGHTGTK